MELLLIRHAPTFGNLEKRYIGRTDEPIVQPPPVPIPSYPQVERVYISPMLRCRQTARLLFRNCEPFVLDGLRECDFGVFEGKNYAQLCADSQYRAWIAGELDAPPDGESTPAFRFRCCEAFENAVCMSLRDNIARAAFVAHGGTLMAILERYANAREAQGFYAWQAAPLCGWAAKTTPDAWRREQALFDIQPIGG
ncbi:histidine phosphatase family protein [Anaerotruncus colihominis]|nr:histidine phosphatase family protein [Anaerotruncus colihominis]